MRAALTPILVVVNIATVLAANVAFKFSAVSHSPRSFLAWQVGGNIAGFMSVLSLTAILRQMDLHVAYPLTAGLGFVLVQVVGARWILHEAVSPTQWMGSALVVMGVVLICSGGK